MKKKTGYAGKKGIVLLPVEREPVNGFPACGRFWCRMHPSPVHVGSLSCWTVFMEQDPGNGFR